MHTELIIRFFSLFFLLIVTDTFLYFSLKSIFDKLKNRPGVFNFFFWIIAILFSFYFIFTIILIGSPLDNPVKYRAYFWVFGVYILIYTPKFITASVIFLGYFFGLLLKLFFKTDSLKKSFYYKFFAKIGIACGVFVFFVILYGFFITKTNFEVRHYTIEYNDLPIAFNNLKISHISDAHLGSFKNADDVNEAVNLINAESPDILFFTGDMINVSYVEALPYIDIFKGISTKYGMFSVLGNHDIGDYAKWDTIPNQRFLNKELILTERKMGFTVLVDTNTRIFAGNDSICIAGVNNCGSHPFKRRGDINKALHEIDKKEFVILLSHDPAIWSDEILNKTDVDLTLAGHTHGMQFGINTKFLKWSPIALKYNYWLGLYKYCEQYLFVNSGLGFLGFPGRVGISPEISVITLKRKS